jgi:hypothetical protein
MPVDKQTVEDQLAAIGEIDRWWNSTEARLLPDILGSEERILSIVDGRVKERVRRSRKWLIVVTSHRLVALRGGEPLGRRQLEVAFAQLGSISHSTGLFRATVTLSTPERKYRMRVKKKDALRFVNALSSLMNRMGTRARGELSPLVGEAELARVYDRIDMLEDELSRMREQMDFMENLLRRRMPDLPQLEQPQKPQALPGARPPV